MIWCLTELYVWCLPLHVSGVGHRARGSMERFTPRRGPGFAEVTVQNETNERNGLTCSGTTRRPRGAGGRPADQSVCGQAAVLVGPDQS